jgi:hypothetical protein
MKQRSQTRYELHTDDGRIVSPPGGLDTERMAKRFRDCYEPEARVVKVTIHPDGTRSFIFE